MANLQKQLVILGLIVVPFYDFFLRLLPYVRTVAPDSRATKEILAVGFALASGLLAVFVGMKPFNNKWLLAALGFILLSFTMSPHAPMVINGVDSGDFFFWKPFAITLCFAFLVIAAASLDCDFEVILEVMVWSGFGMALYVIAQWFGLDQFWVESPKVKDLGITSPLLAGTMGQSTVVASFLAMIVPLAAYRRHFAPAGVIVLAVILTKSAMAMLALGVILIAASFMSNYVRKPYLCIMLTIICVTFGLICHKNAGFGQRVQEQFNGRTVVWGQTISDIKNGAIEGSPQDFSFSGMGIGRFTVLFPQRHASTFQQAHNDYLEFVYNCGLVGLGLLLMGIWRMFTVYRMNNRRRAVSLACIAMLFCALGSFPLQLGAHQYYLAVLAGLLHNEAI